MATPGQILFTNSTQKVWWCLKCPHNTNKIPENCFKHQNPAVIRDTFARSHSLKLCWRTYCFHSSEISVWNSRWTAALAVKSNKHRFQKDSRCRKLCQLIPKTYHVPPIISWWQPRSLFWTVNIDTAVGPLIIINRNDSMS